MTIDCFNYKDIVDEFSSEALIFFPKDISTNDAKFIRRHCLLPGNVIYQDLKLNINALQVLFFVQIIAEWTFHKSIDMIRSNMSKEHWDSILEKNTFIIWDITKNSFKYEISEPVIMATVEKQVNKSYISSFEELFAKDAISKEVFYNALSLSN